MGASMETAWLNAAEAANELGLRPATFYDWLSRSDYGLLEIRGVQVRIDYLQGGAKGQGKIRISEQEVQRIIELLRVKPMVMPRPPAPRPHRSFPGISVPLGRPGRS